MGTDNRTETPDPRVGQVWRDRHPDFSSYYDHFTVTDVSPEYVRGKRLVAVRLSRKTFTSNYRGAPRFVLLREFAA